MGYIETDKVELKRVLNDSFEKEVVAFLNSHDGTIYIGVEDNGNVVGVNNIDKLMKEISDVITDKILPNCKEYVHQSAFLEDGKMIIKVEVKKGNSLYYIKKFGRSALGCYVRIGTTCKSMSVEEIEKGYIKTLKIEEESIIDKRCVRQKLSFIALKTLLISKGQHINEDSFDETYSLLNRDGEYNYYAGLLEDNADVSIKVATFKGKDKTIFLKRQEFGFQCLVVAMKNVISYIDSINETYIDTSVRPRKEKRMFS